MAWDYAELSSMAKENGGPQALLDMLQKTAFEDGKARGKEEMGPILALGIIAAVGVGSVITLGVQKIRNYNEKKKNRKEEIENIKKQLVQEMTYPEKEETPADLVADSSDSELE